MKPDNKFNSILKSPIRIWTLWVFMIQIMGLLNYQVWQNQINIRIQDTQIKPSPIEFPEVPHEIESSPSSAPINIPEQSRDMGKVEMVKLPEPETESQKITTPMEKPLQGDVLVVLMANHIFQTDLFERLIRDIKAETDIEDSLVGQNLWISDTKGLIGWSLNDKLKRPSLEPFDIITSPQIILSETLKRIQEFRKSAANPDYGVLIIWANETRADKLELDPSSLFKVVELFRRFNIICIGTPDDHLDALYDAFGDSNIKTVSKDLPSYQLQIRGTIQYFKTDKQKIVQ